VMTEAPTHDGSSAEVSGCVSSIIQAFTNGLDIFKRLRSRRRSRRRAHRRDAAVASSDDEKPCDAELQLSDSLRRGPQEITDCYEAHYSKAGARFAKGDGEFLWFQRSLKSNEVERMPEIPPNPATLRPAQLRKPPPSPLTPHLATPIAASPSPLSPFRRRDDKPTPSTYTFASDSTKLGEIPMRHWNVPFDHAEAERLNREAAVNGYPIGGAQTAGVEGRKRRGLFGFLRRGE
ncbi:hypothetical protein M011DRAFT_402192, partial [Sporormia fimetaria CBS 119925]